MRSFFSRPSSRWIAVIGLLACIGLPELAMAQAAGGSPYGVSSDDLSKRIFLDYLFGPLTGAGDSPLTTVVKIFNSAILFLGGVFMAYTIIAGTMATAHDGEMLGKKWSSLWLPIRTTLGAAAVMPVIGGGWCAAQAVVVWLATLGIGIANTMWGAYIQNGNMIGHAMYNPPSTAHQVYQTFENMLISNVCVVAYQKDNGQAIQGNGAVSTLGLIAGYNVYNRTYGGVDVLWYGQATEATPTCGMLAFPSVVQNAGQANAGNAGGQWASVTGSTLLNMPEVNSQLIPVQNAAVRNAQSTLFNLAVKIVTEGGTPEADAQLSGEVNQTLAGLVDNYTKQTYATAQNVYQGAINQNYLQTMSKDGWVMAGAFYMEIARAQDQITEALTTLPSVANAWSSKLQAAAEDSAKGESSWWHRLWNTFTPDIVIDSMGRALKFTQVAEASVSGGVSSITNATNAATNQDSLSGSVTDKFVSAFTSSRTNDGIFSTNGGPAGSGLTENPIIMAKNLGNQMVDWAWAAFAIVAGVGLFTIGGAGAGTFSILAGPFTLVFGTLLVGGATLAYYLPMVPYILWLGVVLGWAILLVEAVIAAPLWAVVHMAPDADGVVGRGGQGYMLVLSLTIRPALMILGLVAAISLMTPLGFLINSTFGGAFAISRGPGWGGLTAMVAGCAIYMGVMVSVVNKIFSLIHVVPDRLLRWIGGGGNELGETAMSMEQGTSGKMIAATQAAKEFGAQGQNMLSAARNVRAEKLGRESTERGAQQQEMGNMADAVERGAASSAKAEARASGSGDAQAHERSRQAGEQLMSTGLQSAVRQAEITASNKGRDAKGKSTPESVAAAEAAQQFVEDFQAAKASGEAGWEEKFIASQATVAGKTGIMERQPFQRSIMQANTGREQAKNASENLANIARESAIAAENAKDVPAHDPSSNDQENDDEDVV